MKDSPQKEVDDLQYEIDKRYVDKALQVNFALWSSLLTVNGILIAVFSVLSSISRNVDASVINLVITSLICCLFSLALIVHNFAAFQNLYFEIGKASYDDLCKEKHMYEKLTQRVYKFTKVKDLIVKVLFFSELILVLLILLAQ